MISPQVQKLLADASREAQSGRFEQAAALCREVLQDIPGQLSATYLLGLMNCQLNRFEQAEQCLCEYLEQRTEDPDAWYNLGFARQQQARPEQAIAAYKKTIELTPGNVAANVNLAHLLERTGRTAQAEQLLKSSIQEAASDARLLTALGGLLLRTGKPGEARETLGRAIVLLPDDRQTLMSLAIACAHCGDAEQAIRHYDRLLEMDPSVVDAITNRAKSLADTGRLELAEQELQRALRLNPEHAGAHNSLSVLLSRRGQQEAALESVHRAVELAPQSVSARFNLAALLSKRTSVELLAQAERAAREVLQLDLNHSGAMNCLGIVLTKLGHMDEALQWAGQAVESAPGEVAFSVSLGDLQVQMGLLDQAQLTYQEALIRVPDSVENRRQLGILLLKKRQPESALEALDLALSLSPLDQRSIAHRAVALQQMNHWDEADDYLGMYRHIHSVRLQLPDGFESISQFNSELAKDIQEHSTLRWEPVGLAARNGGLTDELMLDDTHAIRGLMSGIRLAIDELRHSLTPDPRDPFRCAIPDDDYELNSWATLVNEGGNIDTHIHEESWISGAYYVQLPASLGVNQDQPEGWIEFGRPHAEVPFPANGRVRLLRPAAGRLFLFPSFLFHRTIPHRSDEQRISTSFDLITSTR